MDLTFIYFNSLRLIVWTVLTQTFIIIHMSPEKQDTKSPVYKLHISEMTCVFIFLAVHVTCLPEEKTQTSAYDKNRKVQRV